MLSIDGILGLLNDKERKPLPFIYKWRDVFYRMSLHIDGIVPMFEATVNGEQIPIYRNLYTNYYDVNYQYLFDAFLFNRYAREPSITRNWRYSQYKPFTQDPFQRAIQSITGAIFQDSGYQVTIDDKADNDYIWGENFEGRDLVSYFSEKFQNICNDPNGLFLTIPRKPYYETDKEVQPEICFIPSRYITYVSDDEIVFEHRGYTWAVNGIGYFRFLYDEGAKTYVHVDAAQGGYYGHMLGRIPVMVAGGIWNTQGFYESWLKAARPIADEYVIGMSDEQMVMKQASFPFLTFASTDCPDCENGKLQVCTGCHVLSSRCSCDADHTAGSNLEVINCQKCGGTGGISINPGDVMIAPPEEMKNPLVRVDNVDVSINKLHMERNKGLLDNIMAALHLNYIDQAQSGVAKDKDMETRYQFMLKISNDLFDRLIRGAIRNIISLRNVTTTTNGQIKPLTGNIDQYYTIVKPTQFGIYTSFDLNEEYKMSKESGLPAYMLTEILSDYTDKRFGGNDVLKRKTILLNELDMFNAMSYADISVAILNNGGSDRDLQYHLRLPLILDDLAREKGDTWFLTAPFATIKEAAEAKFAEIKPVIPTVQPEVIDRTNINV